MAQKLLNTVQQFSQNEFTDFLKKNGYDELEEVLNKWEITDGEKFLNLNELQIIKWRLPPATKKKLITFITEVKQHPEKFVEKMEKHITNRRPSIRSTHTNIKVKLEQVLIAPVPTESKITKKPIPTPVEVESSSPNEYLAMDIKSEASGEDHYDENGYLAPSQPSITVEENDYEPPPSDKKNNFGSPAHRNLTISQRAPLALPRESNGGYIFGPEDLGSDTSPPLFPRVQQKTGLSNTKIKASGPTNSKKPSSTPPRQIPVVVHDDDEEEDVAYEPIDDYEEDADSGKSSSDMQSGGSDSGTIKRFFSFLKIGKKSDMNTVDQNMKTYSKTSRGNSPIPSKSPERNYSVKDRPLPPLPSRQNIPPKQNFKPTLQDSTRVYENTKKDIHRVADDPVTGPPKSLVPNISYNNKNVKFKSENNLAKYDNKEENTTYGNIDNEDVETPNYGNVDTEDAETPNYGNIDIEDIEKPDYGNIDTDVEKPHYGKNAGNPKYPESYEHFVPENPKTGKRPLPLPPNCLPQIQLDPTVFRCDEESEEYGTFKFNPNNEPFFRNTDRKGARLLLQDLEDGAFLFRPSKKFFLTLSLMYNSRCFNLGVHKTDNNKICLNTDADSMSPEFASVSELVSYFTRKLLTFEHQGRVIETYLKTILPPDKF